MTTIFWEEREVRPNPEGGDELVSTFRLMVFDAVMGQQRDVVVALPKHPVEEGAAVSDHAVPDPRSTSIEVAMSDVVSSEVVFDGATTRSIPVGDGREARVVGADEVQDRVAEALETLSEIAESGTEVDVEGTPYGDLEGYQIASISVPQDTTTGDSTLMATLSLKKRRTVSVREVEAPAPLVERARPNTDRGDQPAEEEGNDEQRDESARDRASQLYSLVHG